MKAKVLIKDFGNIIEEEWDVEQETVKKFADSNGMLYATSLIEKGQKTYYFLKKYLWDIQEELEEIQMRQGVPQKIKDKIKKTLIETQKNNFPK